MRFVAQHKLGDVSSHEHDDECRQDDNAQNLRPYIAEYAPHCDQSDSGRREHQRHDLDQVMAYILDLLQLDDFEAECRKHQDKAIQTSRNWEG